MDRMNARHALATAVALAASLALAGCSDSLLVAPLIQEPLSSLTVVPSSATVLVGDRFTFSATGIDTNGAFVPNPAVRYESSDKTIFTVSTNAGLGIVRGIAEGTATLTAIGGGVSATAQVRVIPATTGWFLQPSSTSVELNDVWFRSDGNTGWAVGDAGTIQTTSTAGHAWSRQTSATNFTLYGVWFTSATEGWVVGAAGTVLHTTNSGALWNRVIVPASQSLYDVAFTDANHGTIVGANGIILSTANGGTTWQSVFPTTNALRAVAFNGLTDGWAVGDAGVIVGTHDSGTSWFVLQPALTSQNLRVVRWRETAFANAAGYQGVTPRTVTTPDSTDWELRNTGAAYQLEGLWFTSPTAGYAVGYNGAGSILVTSDAGQTWTPQTSNTQFRLKAVTFIDGARGWAVGTNGTVLHTVTGGTQ